ncbi:hypothetical protein IT415_02055 [bacterium]|nr:hypothetical protein [bacterium]
MKKSLPIIIVVAIIMGAGIWYMLTRSTSTPSSTNNTASTNSAASDTSSNPGASTSATAIISQADLAKNNGKNGAKCWVAVNGTVYDVSSSRGWENGQHVPSDGSAFCGADMSNVIDQSPHGAEVLSSLPAIGTLQ